MEVAEFKKPTTPPSRKKPKVLDEDEYVKRLERIIQKDFFPDLDKLKVQNEYLEAMQNQDMAKLREIYTKYSSGSSSTVQQTSASNSPATFDTPETFRGTDPLPASLNIKTAQKTDCLSNESVDSFLSKYTSEDNNSYSELMKEAEKRYRIKFPWLHADENELEEKHNKQLQLPSIEKQAALPIKSANVDTWTYKNKNHIMYIPEGVEMTTKEKSEIGKAEVTHSNTRFYSIQSIRGNKETALNEAKHAREKLKEGKIGVDGKELTKPATPQVGNFKFVRTPSPCPGVEESPLMTWGEIEGTPFRLDGGDTPVTTNSSSASFKIAEPPKREKLAHKLAEKVSQRHRDEKVKALRTAQAKFMTPSPRNSLELMSPAAQRLATNKLGIRLSSDRALRASYTPTPKAKTRSSYTPTPKPKTPTTTKPKTPLLNTNIDKQTDLTDNLLKLPKRAKASDFF